MYFRFINLYKNEYDSIDIMHHKFHLCISKTKSKINVSCEYENVSSDSV